MHNLSSRMRPTLSNLVTVLSIRRGGSVDQSEKDSPGWFSLGGPDKANTL
jgi:hypothetical protein